MGGCVGVLLACGIVVLLFLFLICQLLPGYGFYSCIFPFRQGLIDVPKEIAKLEDKKKRLDNTLKKLQDAAAKPDYETKVPANVRESNAQKVRRLTL